MSSVWLRDIDGTGSMHVCAKGDPGAVEYALKSRLVEECAKIAEGSGAGSCGTTFERGWYAAKNAIAKKIRAL